MQLKQNLIELKAVAQARLTTLGDKRWKKLVIEIQGQADTNHIQIFYEATKRIYGPTKSTIMPVRYAYGLTLIMDRKGILDRWAERFNQLLQYHCPE